MPNNILQPKYFLVMQILCLCVLGSKHTTVIVFMTLTGFSAIGWIDVNVEVVVYVCMWENINIGRVQFSNVLLGAEFIWLKFFVDDPPCSSTAVYICCCYNPPKPVYNSQDLVNMLWGNCEEIVYMDNDAIIIYCWLSQQTELCQTWIWLWIIAISWSKYSWFSDTR